MILWAMQPWKRLPADEDIRSALRIAHLENFGELLKAKSHSYAHRAMARATWFRFVMRHFVPSPTNEARRCSAAAVAGLRRALRVAAMRLSASCRFIWLKDIGFTEQSITAVVH